MVARCCVCMLIACILNVPFILEQPGSSVLECHPYFQLLCKKFTEENFGHSTSRTENCNVKRQAAKAQKLR